MHGIFLAIDSNHLDNNNAAAALAGWNKLQPLISICNYYIKESIEHEEERAQFEPLQDADQAKRLIAHMIYVAIKKKTSHFSLDAINAFRARVQEETTPVVAVRKWEPSSITRVERNEILFDIGIESPSEKIVREMAESTAKTFTPAKKEKIQKISKPMIVANKKSGRGRKFNPNSAQHVARRLYEQATDKSREAILQLFKKELGLNDGTAMTYYYNSRKPLVA